MKVNQDAYAQIFAHLLEHEASAHELSEIAGLHSVTVQSLMRCLRDHKVVYVYAWDKDTKGRETTPIYKLGKGKDKPRKSLSAAERAARYRDKQKAITHNSLWRKRQVEQINE
jgi:predicted ArsR family transcriptional regulator